MKSTSAKLAHPLTVDEYLARVPEPMRITLGRIRRAIRSAAPSAEELISYRIPAYRQNGMLVFFAGFKNHCSLFVASKAVVRSFGKELAPFRHSGATIHFTPENPLPPALVKALVKAKLEENEARRKSKTTAYDRSPSKAARAGVKKTNA